MVVLAVGLELLNEPEGRSVDAGGTGIHVWTERLRCVCVSAVFSSFLCTCVTPWSRDVPESVIHHAALEVSLWMGFLSLGQYFNTLSSVPSTGRLITETESVYCAVRSESLKTFRFNLSVKMLFR